MASPDPGQLALPADQRGQGYEALRQEPGLRQLPGGSLHRAEVRRRAQISSALRHRGRRQLSPTRFCSRRSQSFVRPAGDGTVGAETKARRQRQPLHPQLYAGLAQEEVSVRAGNVSCLFVLSRL